LVGKLGCKASYLTDKSGAVLTVCQAEIQRNGLSATVYPFSLQWGNALQAKELLEAMPAGNQGFDLVLASDVLCVRVSLPLSRNGLTRPSRYLDMLNPTYQPFGTRLEAY